MNPAAAVLLLLLLHHHHLRRGAALNTDGSLLLSLKYYSLSDPLSALSSWNYSDPSPCSWNGVVCAAVDDDSTGHVVALLLPGAAIAGLLPPDLVLVQHLRHLDLSGNSLDGPLPAAQLFRNTSELRILNLAGNRLTGRLPPELVGNARELQSLNLSGNAISGEIPDSLGKLPNLTVVGLAGNNFSGQLPAAGFPSAKVLDFSANQLEGGLPPNLAGPNLHLLNLSTNHLAGDIPAEFAGNVPAGAVLDLSYNELSGEIPENLRSQDARVFAGNVGLCGRPVERPCVLPAVPSSLPDSPPAIAAIPKPVDGAEGSGGEEMGTSTKRVLLKPAIVAVIVVGNLAVIGVLAMVWLYVVQVKKKKKKKRSETATKVPKSVAAAGDIPSPEPGPPAAWCCMGGRPAGGGRESAYVMDTTESDTDSDTDGDPETRPGNKGKLVAVDGGESGLETEALLKASAYIVGVSGSGIVYKAVLEDGTTFAVRRIAESQVGRFRDFEGQVRLYARLRHPNLVRIRGFYWGDDEKLLIYDYASNGSLANLPHKKKGTSPLNLTWDVRVRVARGVARGLAYLHDKKFVHGNLQPSNILLGEDMEPMIGHFGLERALIPGGDRASTRQFGSNRSTVSRDSDGGGGEAGPMVLPSPSGSFGGGGPGYHAPESLRNLKHNPKWDVYSFGIVLLELLSGKVFNEREVSQWNAGFIAEDRAGVLRLVDVGLRSEMGGREEALIASFRLGFHCAHVNPQRRPTMKEALQILEKLPSSSSHQIRSY